MQLCKEWSRLIWTVTVSHLTNADICNRTYVLKVTDIINFWSAMNLISQLLPQDKAGLVYN